MLLLSLGVILQNRFKIERLLGQGGFGAVFLARDLHFQDRACVVKQMVIELGASQQDIREMQQNFEREANSLASLNQPGHPNIPEIYDVFSDANGYFIVMKYIEGKTLESYIGTISVDKGIKIGVQLAEALVYMHGRQDVTGQPAPVIHRDIKPANILVDKNDRVWLVDFGLSKAHPVNKGQNTKTTAPMGTLGYVPPEQVKGQAEPRSDVYALAVTFYHLFTGDDPGDHPMQFPHFEKVPENLKATLQVALNNDPLARPTATEFLLMLKTQPVIVSPSPSTSIPQPLTPFQRINPYLRQYAPVFDWMFLGGVAISFGLFALAYLLFRIAGAAIWQPVIISCVVFGFLSAIVGRKMSGEWQRWGLLGLLGGAIVGYVVYRFAGYAVSELGTPLNALWLGGLLGIVIGLVLALFTQLALPLPGFGKGQWAIGIAGVLLIVGIITGVSWLVNDFPKVYAYSQAERYFENGNWEKAKQFYLSTYQRDPAYKETRPKLLQSTYQFGTDCLNREVWDCAEEQFAFILGIDPAYSNAAEKLIIARAEPHYRLGLEYLSDEDWAEAQAEFEAVVAVDPNYQEVQKNLTVSRAEPHYILGINALEAQNWTVAQAELEAVLVVDAEYRDAAEQLITARAEPHYLQGQDDLANELWAEAQIAFEAVIAIKPDYQNAQQLYLEAQVEGPYRAGQAFEKAGAWAEAMHAYEAVLEISATYKDTSERWQYVVDQLKAALYQDGVAQSEQGNWTKAAQSFAELRALDPLYEDLPTRVLVPELQATLQIYYAQQWQNADATLLYTLDGHLDQISDLAFSPFEMMLASASLDGTIKFWDATRGNSLRTLQAHENGVNALDFANFCQLKPGAQQETCTLVLASGGQNNQAIIWDANTGQALEALTLHKDPVTDIAFNMDGSMIATTSVLDDIRIWNTFGGVYRYRIDVHTGAVLTLAWNPLEKVLATAGEDHLINLLNVGETWDSIATMDAHSEPVTSLAFSPDGKFLASGDMQGKTLVWNLSALSGASGVSSNLVLDEETGAVWGLNFSPSGLLLAVGKGHSVQIWLIPVVGQGNPQLVRTFELPSEAGPALAFSPDGWLLATGSIDGKIYVWAPLVVP